jgi:hypothetical protein
VVAKGIDAAPSPPARAGPRAGSEAQRRPFPQVAAVHAAPVLEAGAHDRPVGQAGVEDAVAAQEHDRLEGGRQALAVERGLDPLRADGEGDGLPGIDAGRVVDRELGAAGGGEDGPLGPVRRTQRASMKSVSPMKSATKREAGRS